MHAITLAELASSFVGVATSLLQQRIVPSHEAAQALWTLHRSRCDEWAYRLASHREAMNRSGASARTRHWHEVMPVLQEILLTEPLTRTLACFATQLEEAQLSDEFAPLMHSNLVSHIEARHRCFEPYRLRTRIVGGERRQVKPTAENPGETTPTICSPLYRP